MDRGFVDYKRIYRIILSNAFFIARAKKNMDFRSLYFRIIDKSKVVLYDLTNMLNGHYSAKHYPVKKRQIKFCDNETGKILLSLTNNFNVDETKLAQLYKHR